MLAKLIRLALKNWFRMFWLVCFNVRIYFCVFHWNTQKKNFFCTKKRHSKNLLERRLAFVLHLHSHTIYNCTGHTQQRIYTFWYHKKNHIMLNIATILFVVTFNFIRKFILNAFFSDQLKNVWNIYYQNRVFKTLFIDFVLFNFQNTNKIMQFRFFMTLFDFPKQ